MRFEIKLNGKDFSAAFNKFGCSYYPIRVEGTNSGVSQGGSAIVDLVKVKDGFILGRERVSRRRHTGNWRCSATGTMSPHSISVQGLDSWRLYR